MPVEFPEASGERSPEIAISAASEVTLKTPSRWRVFREARLAGELLAWLWKCPRFGRVTLAGGESVLVLPGFGAGDAWTSALRNYLNAVGFSARGWGLGRNRGNVNTLIPQVVGQVRSLAEESGGPVRLVGWSLGGLLAREAARDRPDLVERVVTLGTPVVGGPRYTVYAKSFERRGFDLDAIEAQVEARNRVPIEVPVVAIYSRSDGIVAWESCIDRSQAHVVPVEVRSSHLGLVVNPSVLATVASSLLHADDVEPGDTSATSSG